MLYLLHVFVWSVVYRHSCIICRLKHLVEHKILSISTFFQDVTVAVPTEMSIEMEKEVLHEEHRTILNAENVTEAKQMLLIYQVGIVIHFACM